jgi:hypothetical protein
MYDITGRLPWLAAKGRRRIEPPVSVPASVCDAPLDWHPGLGNGDKHDQQDETHFVILEVSNTTAIA